MKRESPITKLPLVGPTYATKLEKLDIKTIDNLLHHIPHRYKDYRGKKAIRSIKAGEVETVVGKVVSIKNIYTKRGKKIQLARIEDESGQVDVIWFNQPYLINSISEGDTLSLSGKVGFWQRKPSFMSPDYEKIIDQEGSKLHTGRLVPVYPETAGLSSKWLRRRILDAFKITKDDVKEFLPKEILANNHLIDFEKAISYVHFPESFDQIEKGIKRLSFNELLFLHLKSLQRKREWSTNIVAHKLEVNQKEVNEFIKNLPFKLTLSQEKSTKEILEDLGKQKPMNRLLEGDVGSGKTVVAAIASFVSFLNGSQTIIMAPTQILAEQHFNTLNDLFSPYKIRIGLITSGKKKTDLGRNDIFIGTHALIHQRVDFEKVGLVIIDEQHRFGVEQRTHLIRKSGKKRVAPHVLTMTATPIPRTIALTVYGDLDLSTLTEMPKGRQTITSWIVPPRKAKKAYQWIKEKIEKEKTQAFVVCPLVEESEKESMVQVKAATNEHERLVKLFPKLKIDLLHGRMKAKDKSKVIESFKKGKTNILVATPVVEVGIDIPNATIMVIEGAERFGLSQLHQLRGRVGRGRKKSYCLLFTESKSEKVEARLSALKSSKSGFELAEIDLKLRGPGEIMGVKQHGFRELKIASWQETDLIKDTKKEAEKIIKFPEKYQKIIKILNQEPISPN